MPVRTNFLESILFYQLNLAPAPLLDLAGALSFQVVSLAARLDLFRILQDRPLTPAELADRLDTQERGTRALLQALVATGYLKEKDGRYANSAMSVKWLLDSESFDLAAAVTYWGAALGELWPHAQDTLHTGERPTRFYDWLESRPELSHAFQQMMVTSATLAGPDVAKKVELPLSATRLLDVAGGHGMFSIIMCQMHPNLKATVLDSPAAIKTARINVEKHQLANRIELREGDLWKEDWGQDYDLVLLFNLLHHFDLETNEQLVRIAARALKPGGKLAILEQLEGKVTGAAATAFIQMIALQYYLFVDGRVFSQEEIGTLMEEAGFRNIHFNRLLKAPGTSLAVGAKAE